MYFTRMWEEAKYPTTMACGHKTKLRIDGYMSMLEVLNHIITHAPGPLDIGSGSSGENGSPSLVAIPIYATFIPVMPTPSGKAAFLDSKVNKQLEKLLDAWSDFLNSSASALVLTPEFWLNDDVMGVDFINTFECDPSKPYYGFTSWDNFFTRLFRPGVREVQFPDDEDIINNTCESTKYGFVTNVKERDTFWVKGYHYSIAQMLAGSEYTNGFVGGTVYQAFLSAFNYHRWHSPVKGTIEKIMLVPGTYYSYLEDVNFPEQSQVYITPHATRALVFINADNKNIGLMCFMAVGMVEVSTCDVQVREGQWVDKGDELGMFHFGGSTHCLMFRKGVNLEPAVPVLPPYVPGKESVEGISEVKSALFKVLPPTQ